MVVWGALIIDQQRLYNLLTTVTFSKCSQPEKRGGFFFVIYSVFYILSSPSFLLFALLTSLPRLFPSYSFHYNHFSVPFSVYTAIFLLFLIHFFFLTHIHTCKREVFSQRACARFLLSHGNVEKLISRRLGLVTITNFINSQWNP